MKFDSNDVYAGYAARLIPQAGSYDLAKSIDWCGSTFETDARAGTLHHYDIVVWDRTTLTLVFKRSEDRALFLLRWAT